MQEQQHENRQQETAGINKAVSALTVVANKAT